VSRSVLVVQSAPHELADHEALPRCSISRSRSPSVALHRRTIARSWLDGTEIHFWVVRRRRHGTHKLAEHDCPLRRAISRRLPPSEAPRRYILADKCLYDAESCFGQTTACHTSSTTSLIARFGNDATSPDCIRHFRRCVGIYRPTTVSTARRTVPGHNHKDKSSSNSHIP